MKLFDIYKRLHRFYGPQGWWPATSALEVMVGAVLTQNTAWTNVERAVCNLKKAGALKSADTIAELDRKKLSALIRPAGYYNVKAGRLKNLTGFLVSEYGGDISSMSTQKTQYLRGELLGVNGVGPETCDSILLYALNRRVFVVDAYTRRIFLRHGLISEGLSYDEIQKLFMKNIPSDIKVYNEYHALIVRLAKDFCRKNPKCAGCPLEALKSACK